MQVIPEKESSRSVYRSEVFADEDRMDLKIKSK